MRKLFKQTKVVYDAHQKTYNVYYKNFLSWRFDSAYRVHEYLRDEIAKAKAIERAQAMLDTVEIWKSSEIHYG
jgi:uncharacterized UPF0160 family protein